MAANGTVHRTPTLERVESVPPNATVRHVDQLDEVTLAQFLDLVRGDRSSKLLVGLEPDDIVVFVEYYRVSFD